MRVIGLMSGTSTDAIDVALIETDGRTISVTRGRNGYVDPLGPVGSRPYSAEERALLQRAMREAERMDDRTARPGCLAEAEALVTRLHAEVVEAFLADPAVGAVDLVGFHGQTVLHRPKEGLTVQLGDGVELARRLGVPVVYDLRAEDVAAGGQGAPLVPIFHRALGEACGFEPPFAVLNVGGIANVTFIGRDEGRFLGFDTGPGNAQIDDLMRDRAGCDFDEDGATAARGRPDQDLLAWLLAHPYFAEPPPKSLDRNWFSHRLVGKLSLEDAAATLTAFTAAAVERALAWTDEAPRRWIVAGGGCRNATLMRMLGERLAVEIVSADEIGWSSSHLEAQAFAYLAARNLAGLPITFPSSTGVEVPLTGGTLARP